VSVWTVFFGYTPLGEGQKAGCWEWCFQAKLEHGGGRGAEEEAGATERQGSFGRQYIWNWVEDFFIEREVGGKGLGTGHLIRRIDMNWSAQGLQRGAETAHGTEKDGKWKNKHRNLSNALRPQGGDREKMEVVFLAVGGSGNHSG